MRTTSLVVVTALLFAAPAAAEESAFSGPHALLDRSAQQRHQELSFWAVVPVIYGLGLGVGVRYAIPIVENGFIPTINNSFEIEFGGDVGYVSGYALPGAGYNFILVDGAAEARWTFHFTPRFSAYGKLGVGLFYAADSYCGVPGYYCGVGFWPVAGPGVIFNLTDKITLRAEAGWQGLRGGIGIVF